MAAGPLQIILFLGGVLVGFAAIRCSASHSALRRVRRRAAFLLVPMLACIVVPAIALPGPAAVKDRTADQAARAPAGKRRHHFIHLTWHPPVKSPKPVTGYNIYRSSDRGKRFKKLNTLPVRKPEYTDWNVRHGMTYLYYVKSVDKEREESGPSNRIQLTVP